MSKVYLKYLCRYFAEIVIIQKFIAFSFQFTSNCWKNAKIILKYLRRYFSIPCTTTRLEGWSARQVVIVIRLSAVACKRLQSVLEIVPT